MTDNFEKDINVPSKNKLDIKDMNVQSRIRSILGSVQFDCMECNFTTRYRWDKVIEEVDNLTEWQKRRLDRMYSEMLEIFTVADLPLRVT